MKLIDKAAVVAEIEKRINEIDPNSIEDWRYRLQREHDIEIMKNILSFINTLEVIDPYEQTVQYDSIKASILDHAETYAFNIESELFNQLTKEQQILWRKEIEQAVINGGEAGVELAKDRRYKENLEVKKEDLKKEFENFINYYNGHTMFEIAEHFFNLGLQA